MVLLVALIASAANASPPQAKVRTLHTYQTGFATEVAHTTPVPAANLTPLLPEGYVLAPAALLGLGGWDEGVVVIFNFHGSENSIDNRRLRNRASTRIDLLVWVMEPAAAKLIGADNPGAFHFYSLAYYTDDVEFAASLRSAGMPVEFVPQTTYERDMDLTGAGTVAVNVPSRWTPFYSSTTAFGHVPAGPLNGIFWHESKRGTAALQFQIDVTEQGQAQSLIFTEPGNPLNWLLEGGSFGPGPTDPTTGYESVITPSLNLFYPLGSVGRLWLIEAN
jgi:hypothetical protein